MPLGGPENPQLVNPSEVQRIDLQTYSSDGGKIPVNLVQRDAEDLLSSESIVNIPNTDIEEPPTRTNPNPDA